MLRKLLQFFLPLFFFSCSETDSEIHLVDDANGIDLRHINVGDESAYVVYQSGCDGGFAYTGDTLLVRITERNDSTFLQEEYSAGSTIESSAEHVIIQKDGYVLIPQRFQSQFLFFYGNDTIFLDRKPEIELKQLGCRLFHDNEEFVGDFIGSLDQFKFGDILIRDKKGISCIPTFFDLDAYILYGDRLSMVHVIRDSGEEQNIFGFMAIK